MVIKRKMGNACCVNFPPFYNPTKITYIIVNNKKMRNAYCIKCPPNHNPTKHYLYNSD